MSLSRSPVLAVLWSPGRVGSRLPPGWGLFLTAQSTDALSSSLLTSVLRPHPCAFCSASPTHGHPLSCHSPNHGWHSAVEFQNSVQSENVPVLRRKASKFNIRSHSLVLVNTMQVPGGRWIPLWATKALRVIIRPPTRSTSCWGHSQVAVPGVLPFSPNQESWILPSSTPNKTVHPEPLPRPQQGHWPTPSSRAAAGPPLSLSPSSSKVRFWTFA